MLPERYTFGRVSLLLLEVERWRLQDELENEIADAEAAKTNCNELQTSSHETANKPIVSGTLILPFWQA